MRDISHPTAREQGLIYCPDSEGIRLHVSIYNTAASKGKKKKSSCFPFVQQFSSKASVLGVNHLPCRTKSQTWQPLSAGLPAKGNKMQASPTFPGTRGGGPMGKQSQVVLQTY